ncbi:MAG: ABC transporter permease [Bacillota bacterium]
MFWHVLRKSLFTRKRHFVVAVVAVTMGAVLVGAAATISLNIQDKISRELRSYGPNLTILPIKEAMVLENMAVVTGAGYLRQKDTDSITDDREILNVSPVIEGPVKAQDQSMDLAGLEWQAALQVHPWWELKGGIPDKGEVVLGQEAAKKLDLSVNQSLILGSGQKTQRVRVTGIIQTGGEEDYQILTGLETAQELLGVPGMISRLDVNILSTGISIEAKGAEIEKRVPGSRAKVIQQVAQAEQRLLGKIQALMYFVTLGVLIVSMFSIAGTMTTTVLQRRREIGIMKAIGASKGDIAKLFLSEAAVFGLTGGIIGVILGFGLADVIGITVFSTSMSFPLVVIPLTILCACLVTWIASSQPVLKAVSVDPAITLRGE